jgi:hypothetical protein
VCVCVCFEVSDNKTTIKENKNINTKKKKCPVKKEGIQITKTTAKEK